MKKSLLSFSTFLLISLGSGYAQSFSPIICLPFSGNTQDNSSGAHNGVNYGATLTEDRFGNPNSAYSFNGVDSYIEIPGFGNFIDSNETSISVWCKTNTVKSQCVFMLNPDSAADRFMGLVYYSHNGVSSTIFDHGNLFTTGRLYLETPYNSGWEHYVFISSKALNVMRIYKNGVKIGEAMQNSTVKRLNRNLFIGGGNEENSSGFFFNGSIDDFSIYNEALSDSDVMSLYNDNIICHAFTSSISINKNFHFQVYPNPSNGQIKLEIDKPEYNIEVSDFTSRIVYKASNKEKIDLSFLEKGIYFLTISTKSEKKTEKILITK